MACDGQPPVPRWLRGDANSVGGGGRGRTSQWRWRQWRWRRRRLIRSPPSVQRRRGRWRRHLPQPRRHPARKSLVNPHPDSLGGGEHAGCPPKHGSPDSWRKRVVQVLAPSGPLIHGVRTEGTPHPPDVIRTGRSDGRLKVGTRYHLTVAWCPINTAFLCRHRLRCRPGLQWKR